MINRLAEYIGYKGLSVRAFEISIKASDGMIRRAIKNNSDIQSKWLTIVAENYHDINMIWLLTGEGEMLINKNAHLNAHLNAHPNNKIEQNPLSQTENTDYTNDKIKSLETSLYKSQEEVINTMKNSLKDKAEIIRLKDEITKLKEECSPLNRVGYSQMDGRRGGATVSTSVRGAVKPPNALPTSKNQPTITPNH